MDWWEGIGGIMDLEIKKDNLLEKATIRSSGRVKFLLSKKLY